MKTKWYELLLPQEIPCINVIKHDKIITCTNILNEQLIELYIKFDVPYDIDKYDLIFWKTDGTIRYPCLFDEINDSSFNMTEYLLLFGNCHLEMTACHRQHPNKENIRQIIVFNGKTNYPIHWID